MYGNKQKGKIINHPSNTANHIYLFFDPVHLLKNIRNNLFNSKRFIFYFLSFKFDQFSILLMYQGENMERHFGQKLKFHVKRSRISYWTVEIFMLNGPDFHDKRLRFSCWTVEIFMTNGPDFHDERSWFSQWQVMTGRDFHNDRSKIALLLWLKSRSARGASGHSAFSFRPRISFIYLVDEFFFLLLK